MMMSPLHISPRRRVCSGPRERRANATQMTMMPTRITTTVATTGTTTFRSTQPGIQGNRWCTVGIPPLTGGEMVPETFPYLCHGCLFHAGSI